MDNINFFSIFIDFIITIIAYMLIPFIRFGFGKKEKYTNKQIKIFLIINSAYIAFAFKIIQILILKLDTSTISVTPALFYYWINYMLWKNNDKNEFKEEKDIKHPKRKKEFHISQIFSTTIAIVCIISLSFNVYLGITYHKNNKTIKELKNNINDITDSKNYYENLYNSHSGSTGFLNNYVAIIPENENAYLTYSRWKNSKFEKERFYIMSINDAKNRGYSDKYMQSPIPMEIYQELYFNN